MLTRNELDTHADTCCFNENCFVLSIDQSQTAMVTGFSPDLGSIDVPIASIAVAYDDPITYTTYVLIFHNLLSPFQLRSAGLVVNDIPLTSLVQYTLFKDVSPASHSIIASHANLQIPLRLRGVLSYFETRASTERELSNPDQFPQIVCTAESPAWDPYDSSWTKIEEELRGQLGLAASLDFGLSPDRQACTSHITFEHTFDHKFQPFIQGLQLSETQSRRLKGTVTAEELAKRWKIGLDQARRTIERTTQLAVRDFTNTMGERRIRHSNEQLRYRRFATSCYTDTMFGPVPSLYNRYTCAQVYCTDFDWVKLYPMTSKSEAHYTLDLLHSRYGVFQVLIPDGAKELTEGELPVRPRRPDRLSTLWRLIRQIKIKPNHPFVI
jgi:hypothetical protein